MDVILKFSVSLLTLIVLAGCGTIYHSKDDYIPEGYSEHKISTTEYRVIFETYGYEYWEELEAFLYLRAAEIGAENGYQYFSATALNRETELKVIRKPEVVGANTVGRMGITNQSNVLIPAHDFEFNIRRVAANFHYSNKKSLGSNTVSVILESAN